MKKSEMRKFAYSSLVVIVLASSCGDDVTSINPEGDATYRITFQADWNEADHGAVPGNAHFTTLIGLTHNNSVSLFQTGSLASPGVEEVAETGGTSVVSSEIDALIDAGNGFSKLVAGVSGGPSGSGSTEFTVSEDRPYLSAVSMIAPSPDWFVGISNFKLYDNGVWVSDEIFDIGMYDAGTEDGDIFSLNNPDTDPQENIAVLDETNASVLANGTPGIASIGTVRIERVD
jgi:hypothetical protein